MKFRPIHDALPGEQLIAVSPSIRPFVIGYPKKRLNLYPGRQLTESALTAEHEGRGSRLALYGRLSGSGVVDGLAAALDPLTADVVVSPGVGIAVSGEEVVLDTSLRIAPRSLPVFTPAVRQLPPDAPPNPVLDDFIETPAELLRAGILVLRPVTAELLEEGTNDPCERVPEDAAFENQQLIDGTRLLFYPWSEDWAPFPAPGPGWRNRLAYAVFTREAQLAAGETVPWDEAGVGIGLIAFDENWSPLFLDRNTVVRAASPYNRRSIVRGAAVAGSQDLWQARVNQFAEHLGSLDDPIEEFPAEFQQLPPAGLLTRDFLFLDPPSEVIFSAQLSEEGRASTGEARLAIRPQRDSAGALTAATLVLDLSWNFDLTGTIASVEELFLERTTPRAIVDGIFDRGDVPLQGSRHTEATVTASQTGNLAAVEAILTAPQQTGFAIHFEVITGTNTRGTLRGTLQRHDRLSSPVSAAFPEWLTDAAPVPVEQLDAVFAESASLAAIGARDRVRFLVPVPQAVYDPRLLSVEEADPQFAAFLAEAASRREDARMRRADVRGKFSALYRAASGKSPEFPDGDPGANPGEPPLPSPLPPNEDEDPFGTVLEGGQLQVTRLNEFFEASVRNAPLLPQERALIDTGNAAFAGLERFIETLEQRIQRADDVIDIGFTRLKSDIYRVLQFIVGQAEATRLATSPALAAIAKTTSATATGEQIHAYYQASRQTPVQPRTTITNAGPAPSGGTVLTNTGNIIPSLLSATVTRRTATAVLDRLSAGKTGVTFELAPKTASKQDILGESPIPGKSEIRTTTIASRLEAPRSTESRDYSVATKFQVYTSLRSLEINIADVQVPGVSTRLPNQPAGQPSVFRANPVALGSLELNTVLNEPQAHLLDEAAFFANSAEVTEHTVAALRAAENRVAQYRAVLAAARDALTGIRGLADNASTRLDEIGDSLAEARHDITVGTALLEEEQARVDAINGRRRRIIAEHVRFLAYYRPRSVERASTAPRRSLQPGVTDFAEPRCLQVDSDLPDGLRAFIDLFRDSPVNWFPSVQALLKKVDRLDVLTSWLQAARVRALQTPARQFVLAAPPPGRQSFAPAIAATFVARQTAVQSFRATRAQLDLSASALQSWQGASRVASETLSLGDVIEGAHGRQGAAQQAARELERIERAAACLYSGFGRVPPVVRLPWAELLSQFDQPVNLRNLQVLPRWTSVETLLRRELQAVVDFLFQRIDPGREEAAKLVSDLVRSAILIASHAPINRIVEGLVTEPADVRPNGSVVLAVDTSHVRVGMNVVLFAGQTTAARGVVEDLRNGYAVTRIVQALQPGVRLPAQARAQFVESRALRLLR